CSCAAAAPGAGPVPPRAAAAAAGFPCGVVWCRCRCRSAGALPPSTPRVRAALLALIVTVFGCFSWTFEVWIGFYAVQGGGPVCPDNPFCVVTGLQGGFHKGFKCSTEDQEEDRYEKEGASTTSVPASSVGSPTLKCSLGSKPCKDNTECILYNHVCDGEADCRDGSDERDCLSACETDQFQCAHGMKCIVQSQVCDVDEGCSATEFKCANGQCVSATMLCDGHPDCSDRSDEEGCSDAPVCTTKHRCPHSKECLVQDWFCDGDQDCKDGTDEKDCPVAPLNCGEFQWACKSKTKCVPISWRCDHMKDCDDGSDETDCRTVTCLPHQFQCGSQECLDPSLVCNGVTNCADGSDEGGSCQMSCAEEDDNRCSQSCYSTPQGTRCGCEAGFRLTADGLTCDDIDECEGRSPRVCSQQCSNTRGSYQCDCHPGYIKEADGHRCKITGEPFLLASVQTDLFSFGLRSRSLDVLSSSAKKAILSLDYDWRKQRVYWVSLDAESIGWSSLDQKTTGTLVKGVRADSIAVDWLGRNLYWIDGVNSQIVAVRLSTATVKSSDHSIILDEDLEQPRSLALLPQKGLMFWTEIGTAVKIERAGMDGSERKAVVNSSLGWPGGVAVDPISDRIKETTNPFSLALFNDMIYWSDAKKRVVLAAHKISGKNCQVLLKRPRQPFGVKVIHPLLQMGIDSPCEKMDCSHMCVLAPGPKAVCKCPSSLLLAEDGMTCSSLVNSAFLLMLSPSTVTQIYLQSQHTAGELKGWPEHVALQVPSINEAAIMDYCLRDHTLFLTDDGTTSLSSFKLKDSDLSSKGQLLKLLGNTITAMALDWVTINIYWSSNKQPRLQVTSSTSAHTAVLIKEGIGRVRSIALHPPNGRVCFANMGQQGTSTVATVECANMDGAGQSVVWKDAVQPTSLVFSSNGDTIYWADTGLGTIGSVKLDGSGYRELKMGDGLAAVALSDGALFWITVTDKTRLWYRDEQHQNKLWFEVDSEVISFKAFSKSSQIGSNKCTENNGDCQHLCLATPRGRTCKCAHDHILVNSTHCRPEQRCPSGSRPCLDQVQCQPVEKFCNGHVDCHDHSDENCVHLKQLSKAIVPVPIQPRSSFPHPSTLTPLSEDTGLNTTLNIDSDLSNLDPQQCSKTRCSGNGRCVETDGNRGCVCSLAYRGESCQDHLLSIIKGPVVYAAAGLCAGVVVIAVIALVVVRRKSANTRRAGPVAGKETCMTDLENKAETGLEKKAEQSVENGTSADWESGAETGLENGAETCSQTVPADTDKPEEAASSVD
ncbi:hypothetical protein FQN60_018384, partial [Etheostoma spectabile]